MHFCLSFSSPIDKPIGKLPKKMAYLVHACFDVLIVAFFPLQIKEEKKKDFQTKVILTELIQADLLLHQFTSHRTESNLSFNPFMCLNVYYLWVQ